MKVFFDEDVPRKLARFLTGHEIRTVVGMGWGGIQNGALLALIEREGFEVFITGDKNMPSQQQLENRSFAVLIMSAINWPAVKPHVTEIASAIINAKRGSVTWVSCGMHVRRSKSECS